MTPRRAGNNQGGINKPMQFSANYKIAEVAKRMGVSDLSKMQITTRQIYHAIEIVPTAGNTPQTFNFFQNVNTANFPLTNLTDNKLQAGEALAVERAYLSIIQTDVASPMAITDVLPVEYHREFRSILRSDFDLSIDRQTVTKKINTTSWYAPFNKDAMFGANIPSTLAGPAAQMFNYGQSIYHFDNSFVIIPQIEFSATLTTPAITALPVIPGLTPKFYLMLNLEGLGCLFNPKGNY